MEVQWVGVEPPRLGPPRTAVGLVFSILLGNVYLSLCVTSLYVVHRHYPQLMCIIPPHPFFYENFMFVCFLTPYWVLKTCASISLCFACYTEQRCCVFWHWPSSASDLHTCLLRLCLLCRNLASEKGFCFGELTGLLTIRSYFLFFWRLRVSSHEQNVLLVLPGDTERTRLKQIELRRVLQTNSSVLSVIHILGLDWDCMSTNGNVSRIKLPLWYKSCVRL